VGVSPEYNQKLRINTDAEDSIESEADSVEEEEVKPSPVKKVESRASEKDSFHQCRTYLIGHRIKCIKYNNLLDKNYDQATSHQAYC
jgi:hypothetical protein